MIFGETYGNKVFGPEGPKSLHEALSEVGYRGYLRALHVRCSGQHMHRNMRRVAELYKHDRLEIDAPEEGELKFRAFFDSATLATGALMLAASSRQKDILLAQAPLNLLPPGENDDPEEHWDGYRKIIMSHGQEGYNHASLYVPVFEAIEDEVSPSVAHLNIAKAGFGLPFYIMHQYLEQEKYLQEQKEKTEALQNMQRAVDELDIDSTSIDWDSEFAFLLGDEAS